MEKTFDTTMRKINEGNEIAAHNAYIKVFFPIANPPCPKFLSFLFSASI